uniref:Oxidation resistance protein 1 n=1 Tax=Neogobius melanostomus TaxID=47308 RepID=A0A8C6TVZ7_9GOBI
MFSTKRLKKKSQSVDIASQGFSPTLVPASPLNKGSPPVAKSLAVQENNTTNSQRRNPRVGELKRGYTIDTGQKKTPEKKDGRRMSFQRPKGTIEYSVESRDTLNSISLKFDTTPNELVQLNKLFSRAVVPGQVLYVPDPEYVSSVGSSPSLSPISPLSPPHPKPDGVQPPVFSALRQSRVVSSTSEEEEALTEKFLKINCKYITDGKGAVSGVLLVTPNNIMFDPHRMDPLVQAHGCEEYGIMCPLEEVQSAAIFKEITDPKIRDIWCSGRIDYSLSKVLVHPSQQKEPEQRLREPGANNGSSSTAPRSTEGSISEDVFTESELSPIREEEQASTEDLHMDKSLGASTESVLTLTQVEVPQAKTSKAEEADSQGGGKGQDSASVSQATEKTTPPAETSPTPAEDNPPDTATQNQSALGSKQHSVEKAPSVPDTCTTTAIPSSPKEEANDGTEVSKTDTMQQNKENKESGEKTQKDGSQESAEGSAEKRKQRSHKFLCLRVGKPMKKTFLSNASASMQQYAQLGKKHEYWFTVPQERSDHLYVFFMQWSPDMYGEGVRGMGQEPGFMVIKKNEVSQTSEDDPITDLNVKEWEVVSLTEYHRRIDALNSEDLRSLCKRLQITTKEEVNSKHGTSIKAELEPETFKPNLKEPSDLLEAEQIEKLAKNLPPRTIGYPWTLVFGTAKHGMSIKSLYRAMQSQDTPVLLVIKDSDGQVFGALASEPFKVSDGFYGTGETFLFTFNPEFEVYKWTGDNMFFIKGDMDSLAFGGGSGEFGLWLDGDLYHGRSHSCKTFGNPMLSKKEDFYVQDIEIWAFE